MLELCSINLESYFGDDLEGFWELIFIEMRSCLNLEFIHLFDLMLNGYGILMDEKYQAVNYWAIKNFIQRQTDDNPLAMGNFMNL